MAKEPAKIFKTLEFCSICLDAVNDSGERSIAKLKCGHHFHLDCIGSAFNAKGVMQCPNCRHVEDGQWLYANGSRWNDDSGSRWNDDILIEEISYEDDYEVYQTMPDLAAALEEYSVPVHSWGHHLEWCPYQSMSSSSVRNAFPQFQFQVGDIEGPSGLPEVVFNVVYNHNESASASSPPACPHVTHGLRQPRPPQIPEETHSPHVPMRPFNTPATMSGGSMIGTGIMLSQGRDPRNTRYEEPASAPRNTRYGEEPASAPVMTEDVDVSWTPRYGTNLQSRNGVGATSELSSNHRPRWPELARTEIERAPGLSGHGSGTFGPGMAQYGYSRVHSDGSSCSLHGNSPCPRHQFMGGHAGASHLSPPIRSGPLHSPRSIVSEIEASLLSGTRAAPGMTSGELNRRSNQHLGEPPVSFGLEPPVPGLESNGTVYYSDNPWRNELDFGPSNNTPWTGIPEAPWRSSGPYADFRQGNYTGVGYRHGGASRPPLEGYEQFRNSAPMHMNYSHSFGREGITTELGSLNSHSFLGPQR